MHNYNIGHGYLHYLEMMNNVNKQNLSHSLPFCLSGAYKYTHTLVFKFEFAHALTQLSIYN